MAPMASFSTCQRALRALDCSRKSGELRFDLSKPLARMRVGFLEQRLALDFQLHDAAFDLVDFHGQRIELHAQRRRRFVDQVDGLVGQEAVGDVAMGKRGRGDNRGVLDAHAVVQFVAVLEPAQDGDGVFHGGLGDQHRLEAALQRRILLDVLAVLVEGGGADGAQLAARQRRLEHVRGVHRAFGGARADQRVQFVDEQNDLAGGLGDLLQHGLQAIFEFAAILGAGHQRGQVQRHDALGLEHFGHVAGDDALRQAFDHGRLAHAGFADQHGIILGAPRQNLHHAANLDVAPDHRIELAAAGQFGEVARVLFERAEGGFRRLRGDPVAAAHRRQRLQNGFARSAVARQDLPRRDRILERRWPAGCVRRKRIRP